METIGWNDFKKVDIRVGTIVEVNDFPEARNSAYILQIDFGEGISVKKPVLRSLICIARRI